MWNDSIIHCIVESPTYSYNLRRCIVTPSNSLTIKLETLSRTRIEINPADSWIFIFQYYIRFSKQKGFDILKK